MNKVIFEAIGNTIMFVLLALFFTEGLVVTVYEDGVGVSANIFVVIFLLYMLIYGTVLVIWNKKQGAPLFNLVKGLQMHLDTDERESVATLKATKAAYTATIITLPVALVVFAGAHINLAAVGTSVDLFVVGCWLFALSCIVVNLAFSIAWCIEESK